MTIPIVYEPRTYRDFEETDDFKTFRVVVETSDLYVKALARLEKETERLIRLCRAQIKQAIAARAEFLTSLVPIREHPDDAPIVVQMIRASRKAGTGPMAAVAGAVADFVGRGLLPQSSEVIVENGGDIFLKVSRPLVVGIFAGDSPLSGQIGIHVQPTPIPLGISTSSASVGPSVSLGRSDAATVISRDVPLADAVATALGNRIREARDLKAAVEWAVQVPGVDAAIAVSGDRIAAVGDVELTPIRKERAAAPS
ncbi:MAG: UPF0280 family protein [Desulfomonile tiedjei]|nr:UPF0280 family protein [Desulfomonile tiedjei]